MFIQKAYKILICPYIVILLYLMFFGFGREQMEHHIIRLVPIRSTIKFVQKQWFCKEYLSIIINLMGNIIMFIPFGFLGIISKKYQILQSLMIDFLTCIFIIETLQYFTRLGVFDIDDILLNSFGVCIGFFIMCKFYQKNIYFCKGKNIQQK